MSDLRMLSDISIDRSICRVELHYRRRRPVQTGLDDQTGIKGDRLDRRAFRPQPAIQFIGVEHGTKLRSKSGITR